MAPARSVRGNGLARVETMLMRSVIRYIPVYGAAPTAAFSAFDATNGLMAVMTAVGGNVIRTTD